LSEERTVGLLSSEPDFPLGLPLNGEAVHRDAIGAFGDVASAIGELRDQDELLHLIARKVCDLFSVPRCSIYLREEASGLFRGQVLEAPHGTDDMVKQLICGTEADGLTRAMIETRAPVVVQNARSDPRPVRSAMRKWNVVSMMGVPLILRGTTIGLFFLDSENVSHDFGADDEAVASTFANLAAVAISQSRLYNDLRSSHETVSRQNEALRRVAAIDDMLTSLILKGCNLHEVADAIADLTRRACSIHDAENRQLAAAVPKGIEDAIPPPLLDPKFVSKPSVAEALAETHPTRAVVIGPFPRAGLGRRFMVTPITVRDERWGTLVLSEDASQFGRFDMLVSRRTATLVALEMSAERRAANTEWSARASLAGELIRGNRNTTALESRAQYLGIALHRKHVLCLITADADAEIELPDARTAAAAFKRAEPGVQILAAEVAEGIAAIVELPDLEFEGPAINRMKQVTEEACRSLDPKGRLIAGLSTACTGPGDYESAYGQALEVVRCLRTFTSADILSANDLGPARLFIANTHPAEIDRFTRETLGPLLEGDAPEELLVTLRSFFESGRRVRQSSRDLGVHENTVRYRLSKIEEMIGMPIADDPDAELSVQIALLALKYKGLHDRS
jgi:sugar diacid utilization regulator